jgi:NADP-dependent 3-hydroxy acid dehydrogenase YdfG
MGSGVIAVTGASSGVGRATARAFAREGATVGLIARGREALTATAAEVRSLGGQPVMLECDVADPTAASRCG